ncbi:MAG: sulfatase-like hydrolase/transferase [Akkermansiaceae bacterium]|nr:sulfatase-like hydrolase/transferase [Akkermansiaceae bacterium]
MNFKSIHSLATAAVLLLSCGLTAHAAAFQEGVSGYTHGDATYIRDNEATTNQDADPDKELIVGLTTTATLRGLLEFDVSSISSGDQIDSASLVLTNIGGGIGGTETFKLYAYDFDIVETAATWNAPDAPGTDDVAGGTLGTLLSSASVDVTSTGDVTFANTAAFQTAVASALAGDGFLRLILARDGEVVDGNHHFARFAADSYGILGDRPELLISDTSDPDPDPAGPNVLMIIIDDLNTWIEPLGEYPDVKTPGMNRLAQAGTTFSQAFCQAPACGPSRASFISGLRPSTTGLYGQGSRLGGHPTYAPGQHKTLFESFKDGGYTTAITGKIFHNGGDRGILPTGTLDYVGNTGNFGPYPSSKISDPELSGNSQVVDWGVYPASDDLLPDYQSTTWALNRMSAFKDQTTPFLMAVGLVRPHVPQFAPQAWWDMYPVGEFELPYTELSDLDDTPRFARYLHWDINGPRTAALLQYNELENFTRSYLACISFVDSQVGRLLDGLEANGLDEDTIVVLMSDHGYHVGEKGMTAKLSLWDRATRMPVLIAGPGVGVGQKSAQAIELLDIYPTLLDLCGLPEYAPLEGQSLRPILEDAENAPERLPAITTMSINNHAVSDGRYRYIRYADGSEELYDRAIDPNEATNRIDHPNFRETAARLAGYLPTVNASNQGGAQRFVNIGADGVVTWQGVPIQDPLFDPAGPVTRETLEAPVADEPIVDSDSDGIPDYWEIEVTGSLTVLNAGGHDQDGDGTSDVDEFKLGFDATDATSKPSLAIEIKDQNTLRISHSTAPGRDYKILSSVNLTHWDAAGEPVLGTGFEKVSDFNYDSTTTPKVFYTISDAIE